SHYVRDDGSDDGAHRSVRIAGDLRTAAISPPVVQLEELRPGFSRSFLPLYRGDRSEVRPCRDACVPQRTAPPVGRGGAGMTPLHCMRKPEKRKMRGLYLASFIAAIASFGGSGCRQKMADQ